MSQSAVLTTAYVSVAVQIMTLIISVHGLTLPVHTEYKVVKDLLLLETIVQVIEFIYYSWFNVNFNDNADVTYTRYFDWVLSTPIMLINTAVFMSFTNGYGTSLFSILSENADKFSLMLLSNMLMLIFGYLGEKQYLYRSSATGWGTISFLYTFYLLYGFVGNNKEPMVLFWFMFAVWGFYGVAYLFSYKWKNIIYNILDIFSKNIYGLFLYYKVQEYAI